MRNDCIELTVGEVRDRLFKKDMLDLLVEDYEYGMALDSFESRDNDYFKLSLEERAERIAKHIQSHLDVALYNNVLEILKADNNSK